MIIAFSGFNGSGKTISLTRELLLYDAIFCNYSYIGHSKQKIFRAIDTQELFQELRKYIGSVGGINYIKKQHIKIAFAIDEAGLNFPARSWKNITKLEAYLFAQHRKLGIDFLYTTQNMLMVDRILRLNTAVTAFCWHFFSIGFQKWYVGYEKKKENKLYDVVYLLNKYYKYYNTNEIVDSTKFYIEQPNEHMQ